MKRSHRMIYIAAVATVCILPVQLLRDTLSTLEKRRVVEAVSFALALEQKLEEEAPFESRADLERFFQQGFGDSLAAEMAKFNWPHGADAATPLPESVNVLSLTRNEAVTYYETPEPGLNIDKSNQYAIQKLRNDGRKWIISEVGVSTINPSL